jgi:very-short-patch-repair endonuclease
MPQKAGNEGGGEVGGGSLNVVIATSSEQSRRAWALARRQHQVITHTQLIGLGFSAAAIRHRVAIGRLHRVHRGVYAVGRRELPREGDWLAAVLACGSGALLSHFSAGALYRIVGDRPGPSHVIVPRLARLSGIRTHRARRAGGTFNRIPVTSATDTLIDLATLLDDRRWEAAVNEADSLDLCTPEDVRAAAGCLRRPGTKRVRQVLDRATFVLTDSELERLFLPIALRAGLPKPITQRHLGRHRVDFYWPELNLVIECDSLRYHRTASKQTGDVLRDQAHAAAGRERLRVTHWQVRYEPRYVEGLVRTVAARLAA